VETGPVAYRPSLFLGWKARGDVSGEITFAISRALAYHARTGYALFTSESAERATLSQEED